MDDRPQPLGNETTIAMNMDHVTPFLAAINTGDTSRLGEHLRADVMLASPFVDAPFVGRAAVLGVLGVLHRGVDSFETTAVITGEADVTGVDDLEIDEAGLIASMSVQRRPLEQVVAIQQNLAPLIGVPALELVAGEPG